jgi:hypothetical protein
MSVMTKKKQIKENLSDEAMNIDRDHEVQMARAQLYHLANDAIRLHKLLKNVSEEEGIEGWMQSKITLAADYIKSTADYLEYDKLGAPAMPDTTAMMPTAGMPESVSAGGMGAGSVATVAKPLVKKPLVRR